MTSYDKTVWINDETDLNEDNMNKIENQLETLTNNAITEENKGYQTKSDVQAIVNDAISKIVNGDEVSY